MDYSLPRWVVTDVVAGADYTLLLTFADGAKKRYDAKNLLQKPIYAPLQEPSFFRTAKVECGTVVWNDDIDIAPEHLYECSTPVA